MRSISALAVTAGLLCSAPSARAGDCDGDPGWVLTMPDEAAIGSDVTICMQGPADEMGFFMVSLGQGPVESVYGTICLDFPLLTSFLFDLGSDGNFCLETKVPCDPSAVDLTLYAQFITCKPHRGVSNQASTVITDGICAGDLVTFNEVQWSGECSEGNAGCRLADAFDRVFPNGLTIGDQGGTEDAFYAIHFTNAASLAAFLPANDGAAASFSGDSTDAGSSNAGDFAGQLAAAHLNVALDDAGEFDDLKARPDLKLGDMIFVANVNPDILGFTVRDFVAVCDLAISGALGQGDLDINGDGDPDATLSDLSDALQSLNKNNESGTINRGTIDVK